MRVPVAPIAQTPKAEKDRSVRNRRRDEALGERGGRVLEDAGAEEWRRHPDGSERRNFLKNNRGLRRGDDRRRVRLLILTSRDEGNGALVTRGVGIGVKPRVQLWRSRQPEREKKGREQTTRENPASFFASSHRETTLSSHSIRRKKYLRTLPPARTRCSHEVSAW